MKRTSMKRFTDTDKWSKAWFRKLSPKMKCLWSYLTDKCDQAGVWEVDFELASFQVGESITSEDLELLDGRVSWLRENKILIMGFVEFQCGELSSECNPHKPIIKLLHKHGIYDSYISNIKYPGKNNIKKLRKRLSQKTKEDIIHRDGGECQYCGAKEKLFIDHIIPLSNGGTNEDINIIACCHSCNSQKCNMSLRDFLKRQTSENKIKRINRVLLRVNKSLFTLNKSLFTLKEEEEEEDKDKDKDKDKEEKEIIICWNAQNNAPQCNGTINQVIEISARIKKSKYKPEEIKAGIENFFTILNGSEYYWTQRWSLLQFLQREKAKEFYPDQFLKESWLSFKKKEVVRDYDAVFGKGNRL